MTGRYVGSAVGAVLLLFVVAPALAAGPDAAAVAKALADAVAASGEATLAYASATADGDTVTLNDAVVTLAADRGTVSVPALVLTGVAARTPGGFTAASLAADNGTAKGRSRTVTWKTASLANVIIPTADEVATRATIRPYQSLNAANLTYVRGDPANAVTVESVTSEVGDPTSEGPSRILVHATGVHLPAALLTNSVVSTMVAMLHYDEFVADITVDSAYDTTADTITLNALSLDVANVGKLTLSGAVSHLSLRGLSDPKKSAEARAAAQLDRLSVRIDNAGFVQRMLEMQAQLLGGTPDDVRTQIVDGALPFALSFVSNTDFRDQFQSAVAAFLSDPRSLTINSSPTAPVPLGQALRTAARSPGSLPDLLSLSVQANN